DARVGRVAQEALQALAAPADDAPVRGGPGVDDAVVVLLAAQALHGAPPPAADPPGIVGRGAVARTGRGSARILTRPGGAPEASLADAEAREDPVQDVLARAGAGDLVQGGQRALQILGEELGARPGALGREPRRELGAR